MEVERLKTLHAAECREVKQKAAQRAGAQVIID